MTLYSDSAAVIIDPMTKTTKTQLVGELEEFLMARFQSPLPLPESLMVVFPYITVLIALTLVCFGVTYACFMLQEVRAL